MWFLHPLWQKLWTGNNDSELRAFEGFTPECSFIHGFTSIFKAILYELVVLTSWPF